MKEKFISRIAIIISLIAIILIIETRVEYKHFPDSNTVAATTITTETTEATPTTTSTASATSVSSSRTTQTTTSARTTTTTTSATTAATSQTTTTTIVVTTAPLSPKEQAFITYREESLKKLRGKTQLEGIDISAYQSEQDWRGYIDKADAVVFRYAAGKDELDTMFSTYMEYAKSQHKLVGIYFFTNTNTWTKRNPEEYADWCIENTKDYLGYAVYALDCEEAEVLDCEWILRYLRRFQERTGVKPVLYTYQALLNRSDLEGLATIRSESYGLWIANYGDNDGSVTEFGVVKWEENKVFAHQYVSKPEHLCRDIFFCTPEAWYKFAKTNKTPT